MVGYDVIRVWLVVLYFFFFVMIRRPPRSTQGRSSAASDVYKRQDNTYSATLEFIFHKDEPVWLQWGVGDFNPSPIIGRSFTAQYEKEKREGIIPVLARFVSVEDSTVARGFNKLLVDSRMGPIEIESDAQTGIIFFDYRKSVHADINKPIFWMGVLDREFEPQKPHTFFVTMRFPKAPRFESQAAENISLAPKIANTNSAKVPSWGRDYIIPKPKQLKWTQACLLYTSPSPRDRTRSRMPSSA